MAARAMQWPAALPPRQVHFTPSIQSKSGGLSLAGSEQITISGAGRWQATVTVALRGEVTNLALRAFIAQMAGRAGTVLVPRWDRYRPADVNGRPFSQPYAAGYGDGNSTDGGSFNFDLSGFGQSADQIAWLAAGASSGATQISVETDGTEGPRPGHEFGIGQRLYRASHVWREAEGEPTTVQFWPPLREGWLASEPVIVDRPVCLMRFASDDVGTDMLNRRGSGGMTFELVEAV